MEAVDPFLTRAQLEDKKTFSLEDCLTRAQLGPAQRPPQEAGGAEQAAREAGGGAAQARPAAAQEAVEAGPTGKRKAGKWDPATGQRRRLHGRPPRGKTWSEAAGAWVPKAEAAEEAEAVPVADEAEEEAGPESPGGAGRPKR